ncbi:MAG: tetratricopeptide repeat protein [Chthoniobacterales bacterium]
MNPKNFFAELKRRNVYRIAVAYAVVAWLLIQVATQVFPFFEVPHWAVRFVILLIVIGFFVALVLAWLFELTPEGVKRSEDVAPQKSTARATGRKLDFVIIAVLALAVASLVYDRLSNRRRSQDSSQGKSIAVLPFDNFSDNKEDGFFADGIQDDILTSLGKIRDLKVISRTSVMAYRGGPRNLREIAGTLGVSNILEGSVRRAKNRVLVNVQLIDPLNDRHVWADRYDRTMEDVIGLQGQLAGEIATALRATLTPEEKVLVAKKPTTNADAYVLYLRARERELSPDTSLEDYKVADRLYSQAIALDPSFAQAYARLATTRAAIFHFYEPLESWKGKVRAGAEEALRLQPNLGEGHVALGLYHFWMERDYDRALGELGTAEHLLPSDSNVRALTAAIRRRQGRWQDAYDTYRQIEALDPQNPNVVRNLVITNNALRHWDESEKAANRLEALAPDSIGARIQAAYVGFWRTGKTEKLRAVLAEMPPGIDPDGVVTAGRWDSSMIDRDFDGAERAVASCQQETVSYLNGQPTPKAFLLGCIAVARGDSGGALSQLETVRSEFAKSIEEAPDSAERHANLGMVCAFMGRKDEAIREGRRAMDLTPVSQDAFDGAIMQCFMALIYARLGENDQAIQLIERLITFPGAVDTLNYSITMSDLRKRWEWDPLRNDPRFQKIIAGPEPKTVYK